jgi:hypothetical protein
MIQIRQSVNHIFSCNWQSQILKYSSIAICLCPVSFPWFSFIVLNLFRALFFFTECDHHDQILTHSIISTLKVNSFQRRRVQQLNMTSLIQSRRWIWQLSRPCRLNKLIAQLTIPRFDIFVPYLDPNESRKVSSSSLSNLNNVVKPRSFIIQTVELLRSAIFLFLILIGRSGVWYV